VKIKNLEQGFIILWASKQLNMNYPRINKALIIIKGIKLFHIFILQKLFEFHFQS
jgi:hypothetical protein